jgi:hypothetical protein
VRKNIDEMLITQAQKSVAVSSEKDVKKMEDVMEDVGKKGQKRDRASRKRLRAAAQSRALNPKWALRHRFL